MRILFAFIARQWRLVTPLFLTALTGVVIAGMTLVPASAHADRPVSFSGFANGVRAQTDTVFNNNLSKFFVVSSAKFTNCGTGNVEKHGTSHLGPITSGQPLIDVVLLADGSATLNVVATDRCAAEVTAKLKKGADGVGSVDAHAALSGGQNDDIDLLDISTPTFTASLIDFEVQSVLESEAKAFCNTEGHAKVEADIMGADFNSDFFANGMANEFLGIQNQTVQGLEGTGYSATLNEVDSSVSGSHGSITVIGFHLTGNGVDIRLAESHADIKCPK